MEALKDAKIHAAVQEILEVVRKHDLSIFFCLTGREMVETRWRFSTWSCFEQSEHPEGSSVNFRTRVGGTGDRRSEEDIADSCNIARSFAQALAHAAIPAIKTWKALEDKLGAEATRDDFLAPPPAEDMK